MNTSNIFRIFLIPIGLLKKIWSLALEGGRDIHNNIRFKNSIIDEGCCINEKSTIEPHTHILHNCIINDCLISSYSYIGNNCLVQNASIGRFCSIANDVFIGLGKHPTDLISTSTLFYRINNTLKIQLIENDYNFEEYEKIEIGNDVWIGARAIILDGIKIGNGAIIAANSVVTKDVPPYAIVGGVPAKIIKYRFDDDKINKLAQMAWWTWPIERIKAEINELINF